MDAVDLGVSHGGKSGKSERSVTDVVAAARAKWPVEVRTIKKGVMEGYRQMVFQDGRRFRFYWRSLKGVGFWVTAKGAPVFGGKTLPEATLKLAVWADA
jgi:hypothetical protein